MLFFVLTRAHHALRKTFCRKEGKSVGWSTWSGGWSTKRIATSTMMGVYRLVFNAGTVKKKRFSWKALRIDQSRSQLCGIEDQMGWIKEEREGSCGNYFVGHMIGKQLNLQ